MPRARPPAVENLHTAGLALLGLGHPFTAALACARRRAPKVAVELAGKELRGLDDFMRGEVICMARSIRQQRERPESMRQLAHADPKPRTRAAALALP